RNDPAFFGPRSHQAGADAVIGELLSVTLAASDVILSCQHGRNTFAACERSFRRRNWRRRRRGNPRRGVPARSVPRARNQFRVRALAKSFWFHSARKIFISALSPSSRGRTPLYFFVTPLTTRLTAPWLTKP